MIFSAPCRQSIEDFLQNPTLHLTKDEATYLREQFIHISTMKDTLMEYCLKTNTSYHGIAFANIELESAMSEELKSRIVLAKEFADFIYGAYIVYNLMFWENGGDYATVEEREVLEIKYQKWKKQSKGLPHREEILKLVIGHEGYKISLRDFLIKFEAAVKANITDVCSDEERKLVKAREHICKREKAKLGRDYPFSEIQSFPMDYRHSTGQIIIADILNGMERQ